MTRDRIYLRVSDTGCGIPAADLQKVFLPFFTTKGTVADGQPQNQIKGTGLGLSLCHRIVENHGGEIRVESNVDIGTTFTIWLPVRRGEKPGEKATQADGTTPVHVQGEVLVVDDEEDTRDLLALILPRAGMHVLTARDGEEALRLLQEKVFDVVLMDLQMPGMNGLAFYHAAQRLKLASQPEFVLMTGHSSDLIRRRVPELSTLPHVRKPFETDALLQSLRVAVGRRRQPATRSKAE